MLNDSLSSTKMLPGLHGHLLHILDMDPEAQVFPFQRRGRTDHVVLLREDRAQSLKQTFPSVAEGREIQKREKSLDEPPIVWESVGTRRYGRLRQSPSRVTRPAANLQELPVPGPLQHASPQDQFAGWMEHWQITPLESCRNARDILLGAFAIGMLEVLRDTENETILPKPRLALDQNQHVGNRTHLIIENQKPASPFPLHILLYSGPDFAFQVAAPNVSTAFKARTIRPDNELIARTPKDRVRFYANPAELKKDFCIPPPYKSQLRDLGLLGPAHRAQALLREYFQSTPEHSG